MRRERRGWRARSGRPGSPSPSRSRRPRRPRGTARGARAAPAAHPASSAIGGLRGRRPAAARGGACEDRDAGRPARVSREVDFSRNAARAELARPGAARPCSWKPLYMTTRVSGRGLEDPRQRLQPVHAGHRHVEQHQLGPALTHGLDRLGAVAASPTTSSISDSRSRARTSARTSAASSTTTIVGRVSLPSISPGHARNLTQRALAVVRSRSASRSGRRPKTCATYHRAASSPSRAPIPIRRYSRSRMLARCGADSIQPSRPPTPRPESVGDVLAGPRQVAPAQHRAKVLVEHLLPVRHLAGLRHREPLHAVLVLELRPVVTEPQRVGRHEGGLLVRRLGCHALGGRRPQRGAGDERHDRREDCRVLGWAHR